MAFGREELALTRVPLEIWAEIGAAELRVGSLLQIGRGAVISLNKSIEGEVDLKIGKHIVARGNLLANREHFSVRITKTSKDIHE